MERVKQDNNDNSRVTTFSADFDDLQAENFRLKQELQFKEQFITMMNHELRTPLNAILGLSEALMEQAHGPINARQMRLLNGIDESGRILLSLICDVLDVLNTQTGESSSAMSEIVPQDFLAMCVRLIEPQAQKRNIRFSPRVSKGMSNFVTQHRLFKQLALIVLAFGVKNSPLGSSLLLDLSPSLLNRTIDFKIITHLQPHTYNVVEDQLPDIASLVFWVKPILSQLKGSIEQKSGENCFSELTISIPWLTVTSAEYVSQYTSRHTPLWG